MAIFEGAGVAIITPFKENGDIDFEGLEKLIDFQIENGTDAIIICGTTGEASTMCDEEHLECIKIAVDRTNHRLPVIAGTGSNDTRHGIELTKRAKALGVDATLQVTPYYNKATQKGLVEHFTAIGKAVDLPMILYNVPSRTGVKIGLQALSTLSKYDFIAGVKDATGDLSEVADVAALCPDLPIYSGNDDQILPVLSLGGKGVISVLSNVAPRETHDMVKLFLEGKNKEARDLQLKFLPLIHALFCEVNPIPVKAALNLMNMPAGPCRLPLTTLEKAHTEELKIALKNVGLLA